MNQAVDIKQATSSTTSMRVPPCFSVVNTAPTFTVENLKSNIVTDLEVCGKTHTERQRVESFIADVYFNVHRATLKAFLPSLFAIRGDGEQVEAAIGMRRIGQDPIFLEQYLEESIDAMLSSNVGQPVLRQSVAEVGNLASISAGASRTLIAFMVYYLQSIGIEWAVCTGTDAVRAALKRVGVHFDLIAHARGECLGEEQVHWGSYYRNNPCVLAVNIPRAAVALRSTYHYLAGQ